MIIGWKLNTPSYTNHRVVSNTTLFFLPAMKNNSDSKFSYQQLPVSLKLIYTILQVLALNNWILKRRHKQTGGIHGGFSVIYLSLHVVHAESHVSFVFRKCPSLRSLTSCSTCWTVWRSCVSMESVCTSPARITPSFWLTSRKRCSSRGACRVIVLVEIVAFYQLCDNNVCVCLIRCLHFSLWSMLKSEFCQLASLAVPQLLHALSLSHGADIFWNLINTNFNSKDWKIRFEAGEI